MLLRRHLLISRGRAVSLVRIARLLVRLLLVRLLLVRGFLVRRLLVVALRLLVLRLRRRRRAKRAQVGLLRLCGPWCLVLLSRPRRRLHHRQRRARRSLRLLGRGDRARVDGDGDLDRAAELLRQRVDDQGPELGLQVLLHERVRGSDQRRVLHEAERPGQPEPGELARLESHPGEPVKGPCPHLRQINVSHRWLPSPRSRTRVTVGSIREIAGRNSLSTGSSTGVYVGCGAVSPYRGGSQPPKASFGP